MSVHYNFHRNEFSAADEDSFSYQNVLDIENVVGQPEINCTAWERRDQTEVPYHLTNSTDDEDKLLAGEKVKKRRKAAIQ